MEIIVDRELVKMVIDDIHADRDVNIEITRFIYNTDFYKNLEKTLQTLRKELASTDDRYSRKNLNNRIATLEEDAKNYKIKILQTACSLYSIEDSANIITVKKLFFNGTIHSAFLAMDPVELSKTQKIALDHLHANQKLHEVYKKLVDNANEYLVKAQLTALNLEIQDTEDRFHKTMEYYEKGQISAERSKDYNCLSEYMFQFALFFANARMHALSIEKNLLAFQASQQCKVSLEVERRKATILHNLGYDYSMVYDFPNSEKYFEYALKLRQNLLDRHKFKILLTGENVTEMDQQEIEDAFQQVMAPFVSNYEASLSRSYIQLARMLRLKMNFDQAEKYSKKAVELCQRLQTRNKNYAEDYGHALNGLGLVLLEKNDYAQAEEVLIRAKTVREQLVSINSTEHEPWLAVTLFSIGNVYLRRNKFKESSTNLNRALQIFNVLTQKEPQRYSLNKAEIFSSLGILASIMGDLDDMERYFIQAINILTPLVETNPDTYALPLAIMFQNWGEKTTDVQKALQALNNSLEIFNKYSKDRSERGVLHEIRAYQRLIHLHLRNKNFTNAEVALKKAISISQNLEISTTKIPVSFMSQGADFIENKLWTQAECALRQSIKLYGTLYKGTKGNVDKNFPLTIATMGEICRTNGRFIEAEKLFVESLNLFKQCADSDTVELLPHIVDSYNALGYTYLETNKFEQAELPYLNAIRICRQHGATIPDLTKRYLPLIIENLFKFIWNEKQRGLIDSLIKKSLLVLEDFCEEFPYEYSVLVSKNYNALAVFYLSQRNLVEAQKSIDRAYTFLASMSYREVDIQILMTLKILTNLYVDNFDYGGAVRNLEKACKIYERLNNSGEYEDEFASSLNNLGEIYSRLGAFDKAQSTLIQALQYRRQLAKRNPPLKYEADVAQTLSNLAKVYTQTNQLAYAEALFKESLEIYEQFRKVEPEVYDTPVAATLNNLSHLYIDQHNYLAAETLLKRALLIREQQCLTDPQAFEPFKALVLVNLSILYFYFYQNRIEALEFAKKAEPICIKYLHMPEMQQSLQNIKEIKSSL